MWLKIKVLLWKSLQLRKRHWFATILEIIVPCLLFFFTNYFKSKVGSDEMANSIVINQTIPNPISENEMYEHFSNNYHRGYFIYTPKTKETEQIMKIVAEKLNIDFNSIQTVNNEFEMVTVFKNRFNYSGDYEKSLGFGIVFEETIKSRVFKYKIRRTNEGWQTDRLFPMYEIPGPMDFGQVYFERGFLALQLTLDKAFITLGILDNNNSKINDYNLKIQSYPYANYTAVSIFQQLFQIIFPFITVLSFLLMCSNTIKRVVEEKDSGVKELMKMMGLKSWMIWTGWILHNFFVYAISITIITYISCYELYSGKGALLTHTNPLLFWTFLIMYMMSGIFFCFAISSLFNRPLIALIAGSMAWTCTYSIPANFIKPSINIFIKTILLLLPNVGVINAYTAISSLESQGKGLQFSTLFTTGKGDSSFSVGFVLFMFLIDCVFYGFIAWFMDSVMPGKYGIAKPLHFMCKWSKTDSEKNDMVPINKSNSKLFEKPPNNYEVGISVQNLHKRFGNFNAVNGVNLDIYKGQITALLGHNGAGKTTTMSIITGILLKSIYRIINKACSPHFYPFIVHMERKRNILSVINIIFL